MTRGEPIAPGWRRWADYRLGRLRDSMSGFLLYLVLTRRDDNLRHHTILIGDHYRCLVGGIFGGRLADDCSIYPHWRLND